MRCYRLVQVDGYRRTEQEDVNTGDGFLLIGGYPRSLTTLSDEDVANVLCQIELDDERELQDEAFAFVAEHEAEPEHDERAEIAGYVAAHRRHYGIPFFVKVRTPEQRRAIYEQTDCGNVEGAA